MEEEVQGSHFIQDYWEQRAARFGISHAASWADIFAIKLEIDAIGRHLREGDQILDVGCGNGFSLVEQCRRRKLSRAVGVDFSSKMIRAAKDQASQAGAVCEFEVGNLCSLSFPDQTFDAVYTSRAIINLPTWSDQKRAILECLRVAKPRARVVFSEAFWEPLCKLNALRAVVGLPPLVEHDFNRYLKKSILEKFLTESGIAFQVDDFSSVYYLGSRFLRELVGSADSSVEDYSNPINEAAYQLELQYSGGGIGIQQLYALEKPPTG